MRNNFLLIHGHFFSIHYVHFPSHNVFLLKHMIWFLFFLFLTDFLGMKGFSVHAEQLLNWGLIIVTSSGWFKLLATHPTQYAKCSLLLGTSSSVCHSDARRNTEISVGSWRCTQSTKGHRLHELVKLVSSHRLNSSKGFTGEAQSQK